MNSLATDYKRLAVVSLEMDKVEVEEVSDIQIEDDKQEKEAEMFQNLVPHMRFIFPSHSNKLLQWILGCWKEQLLKSFDIHQLAQDEWILGIRHLSRKGDIQGYTGGFWPPEGGSDFSFS